MTEEKALRARGFRREMTAAECMLWDALRGNKLAGLHFRRQQVIDGFIVDFYCHAAGLVIEVDGEIHEQQPEYDRERERILAARGLEVLRVRNDAVLHSLPAVLQQIRERCEHLTPPAPFPRREGGVRSSDG